MARTPSAARGRLIQAALNLFVEQGFTATTTRQIADQAQVNEATLFRNFGSKHDLLLAVMAGSGMVQGIAALHQATPSPDTPLPEAVRQYVSAGLADLEPHAALLRALLGEVSQYSPEQRQTLGDRLRELSQGAARYFAAWVTPESSSVLLSSDQLASLIHSLVLSHVLTAEFTPSLWASSDELVASLVA
ncbi:MAG: TetR/AcrR family transcriptional regulator, partial [Spirulinaceae cyanobacterium]